MKNAVYDWIKYLAVFYILLTTIINLVPTGQYERYIRFFMGILLIFMLCSPLSLLLGKSRELYEGFGDFYEEEERLRMEQDWENLQEIYLQQGIEEAVSRKILENLKENGIEAAGAKVHIEGEKQYVTIWMENLPDEKEERRIRDALGKEWGIGEREYQIRLAEDGKQTVGFPSSAGGSADCNRSSGVR